MAKGAANEEAVGELHDIVTGLFKRVLKRYEGKLDAIEQLTKSDIEDEVMSALLDSYEPSPAMLSAVTKFLKDNEVTYDTEALDELGALQERLDARKRARPTLATVTDLPLTGTDN